MRLVAVALGLLCATQLVAAAPVAAQATDTEQLLEQFERALNTYDEDAVVQLFWSDGAVRDNHGGEVITQSQLRGWVRKARDSRLHAHLGDYTSDGGRTHFIIEVGQGEWYREGGTPVRANGTAEIRGGRIVALVLDPAGQTASAARSETRAAYLPRRCCHLHSAHSL